MLSFPSSLLSCRYRPAYKAFKTDSSFNFMMFFFIFSFQALVTTIQTIGFPGSGTCGVIMAISQFSSGWGVVVGLFLMCIALAYGTCAAGNIFMLTKVNCPSPAAPPPYRWDLTFRFLHSRLHCTHTHTHRYIKSTARAIRSRWARHAKNSRASL